MLEDIIAWVNTTKTTPNQNVVLGQSMGGVIARYALADMEHRSLNHDTRLYISHDAPHQGANIPIGLQYFARHLADQFVSTPVGDFDLPATGGGSVTINDIQNVFNSTGTRQLLANNINSSFSLDNTTFNTWQTELRNMGYPQQTRNIAISNGSHCANTQDIGPQQELLHLSGDISPTVLLDAIINFFPFLSTLENLGYIALAIILEDPAYLAGLLPGRTNLNARFEAKALPSAGSSANVYSGRIRITKKINFILASLTYNINVTDRNYSNPNSVQLPFDSYPGGAYLVPFDLSDVNESENNWFFNLNLTGRSANSFNFIPTPTALDAGVGNTTLNDNDYLRRYNIVTPPTGSLAIPFDNYTTSFNLGGTNEAHISFNTRNGDWLAAELVGTNILFTDCSYICSNTSISGIDQVCSSATYSVPSGGTFHNWSLTEGNGVATLSGTGNSVTLTRNGASSGYVTIRVEYGDGGVQCGDIVLTKRVFVGTPIVDYVTFENGLGEEGYFCTSHNGNTFEVLPKVRGANYQYRLLQYPNLNVVYTSSILSGNRGTVYYIPSPGWYAFEARIMDSCGTSAWGGGEVEYVDCSTGGGGEGEYRYMVYPNPTSSEINVAERNKNTNKVSGASNSSRSSLSQKKQEAITSMKIYDFTGNLLIEKQSGNFKSVNVSNLKQGIYYLEITTKDTSEVHRVVVEK